MTDKQTEARLGAIEDALGRFGSTLDQLAGRVLGSVRQIRLDHEPAPEDRADYIEHGSLKHQGLLGIFEVESAEAAKAEGYMVTYESPRTGRLFCLEDELGALNIYPTASTLEQAATVLLRQRVNELEGGRPEAPEGAKPLWRPNDAAEAAQFLNLGHGEKIEIYEPGVPWQSII